jgi:hypothetical protein
MFPIIVLGFLGTIVAAIYKHFWMLLMILIILMIYGILTYLIEKNF